MNLPIKRLVQFEEEYKDVDLADYYQLPKSITIDKKIKENTMFLTFRYTHTHHCPTFDLPPEIVAHIRKYLTDKIEINTQILYSTQYPFVPPIWFFQSVRHTLPVDLTDYYIDKVTYHNSTYLTYMMEGAFIMGGMMAAFGIEDFSIESIESIEAGDWTPAISVEKDILYFLQKINHFEEILVCAR